MAGTLTGKAESISLPTPEGLPDEMATIMQGGLDQTARYRGIGRGWRAHEADPQAGLRTGSATPEPTTAECRPGDRERDF